jgi:hypothetical protein
VEAAVARKYDPSTASHLPAGIERLGDDMRRVTARLRPAAAGDNRARHSSLARFRGLWLSLAMIAALPMVALAHGVAAGDKGFIQNGFGIRLIPFAYLGAKHMVTGYDHLLFLVAVIFFLYRLKDIAVYVTLFAVGHSVTLLVGVLAGARVNPFVIDAIIGFSVVYKALDNLGVFERWPGRRPDPRIATLVFGLCHGLGLATKILDFRIKPAGLVENLVAFNVGVELGQLFALSIILIAMSFWRKSSRFTGQAVAANVLIMIAGVGLIAYQINEFLSHRPT